MLIGDEKMERTNKNFVLIISAIFIINMLIFISCTKNKQNTVNEKSPKELELVEFIEETMKETPKEENEIQIIKADIVATFEENDDQVVLANIYELGFIPKDGVFTSSSGAMFPVEIHYAIVEDGFTKTSVIYTMDGSEFSSSVKKMSRNNTEWYNELMESQNSYHQIYNPIIEKLKSHIDKHGMKDYIHNINQIPEYEKDVIHLKNLENEPKGNIAVVKRTDYYAAKEEIGIENWPHYKGILFNEATGICVESIFDEFPE